jgi:hypothetical protein
LSDSWKDETRATDGCQIDQRDTIAKVVDHVHARLECETRLAHAGRPGQGKQANTIADQSLFDRPQLGYPADKRGCLQWRKDRVNDHEYPPQRT